MGVIGGYIISASKDGLIKMWNSDNCEMVCEIKGHDQCVNQMVSSPSSDLLFTCSNDKTVKVWKLKVWKRKKKKKEKKRKEKEKKKKKKRKKEKKEEKKKRKEKE